ncbi:MAG: hypothetical protein P0Y66_13935 [Candidatus Kaistia colombiensis]|nr:MAG: hypothetical protein P0Y66_13935 [Kaistia sp.]
MQGIEHDVERMCEQMNSQTIGEGHLGIKLMQRIAPPLIAKITAAQAKALAGVTSEKRGRPQLWWWMIQMMWSGSLAVIVLNDSFRERQTPIIATCLVARILKVQYRSRSEQTVVRCRFKARKNP